MKDTEFKSLNHIIPENCKINSRGGNIAEGYVYRPGASIANEKEEIFLVLENLNNSDRTPFIGAMTQAFKFAGAQETDLCLLFVMKESGNKTTVKQVAANIRAYYIWLKSLGAEKLTEVLFIADTEYQDSVHAKEALLSNEFRSRCVAV